MKKVYYGLTCKSEILKERGITYRGLSLIKFKRLCSEIMVNNNGDGIKYLCKDDDLYMYIYNNFIVNLDVFYEHIMFCIENNIPYYRIPELGSFIRSPKYNIVESLIFTDLVRSKLKKIRKLLENSGIRVGMHPDQFNVLGSFNEEVRINSRNTLEFNSLFLEELWGEDKGLFSPINVHVQKNPEGTSDKEVLFSFKILAESLGMCSSSLLNKLTFENEDKGYWNCQHLYECWEYLYSKGINVALVFDNLHNKCNPSFSNGVTEDDSQYWIDKYKPTWKGITPVYHWSFGGKKINNGKINPRAHVDYAEYSPRDLSVIWELEVKAKDKAILKLRDADL